MAGWVPKTFWNFIFGASGKYDSKKPWKPKSRFCTMNVLEINIDWVISNGEGDRFQLICRNKKRSPVIKRQWEVDGLVEVIFSWGFELNIGGLVAKELSRCVGHMYWNHSSKLITYSIQGHPLVWKRLISLHYYKYTLYFNFDSVHICYELKNVHLHKISKFDQHRNTFIAKKNGFQL